MENREQRIKQKVKERYTEAVSGDSCCGGTQSGVVVISPPGERVSSCAGYRFSDLRQIPEDAIRNSFGCGNPVGLAEIKSGQTVLDIGSGAGIDCFLAADRVGPNGKVIGLDMTPLMIEKATQNAQRSGFNNVEFRLGDAESMPLTDRSVDWIISNCVINLSPNKSAVFREMFRVLKPGGKISVSDIMLEQLPWFLRHSKALYTSCVSGAIPELEYLDGLRKAGLMNADVTERIIYDENQILNFLQSSWFFRVKIPPVRRLAKWIISRFVSAQIWSARIVAEKAFSS